MRTTRWIGTAMVATVTALTLGAAVPKTGITVAGGTPPQQAMAEWAVGRFVAGGLSLPPLEIRFHPTRDGCRARLGYYLDGAVDLCGTHTNQMARRTLLHEMAHGWVESNLSEAGRDRFLELRALSTWNDHTVAWEERGFEQAAEIMSWALGDQGTGILRPSIPRNSLEQLTDAYELLTGNPLPS
jgi:hypothetical protein